MAAPTVLIIANPYEAQVMRRAVGRLGFNAVVADRHDDAIEKYETEVPSLVVAALGLCGNGADNLLTALRGTGGARVPFLLVCDRDEGVPDAEAARALGADQVLHRPVEVPEIRRLVAGLIGEEGIADLSDDVEVVEEQGHATPPPLPSEDSPSGHTVIGVAPPPSGILRADDALFDAAGPMRLDAVGRAGIDDDALDEIDLDQLSRQALPPLELEAELVPRSTPLVPVGAPTPRPLPSLGQLAADAPLARLAAERLPTPVPAPPVEVDVPEAGDLREHPVGRLLTRLFRAGFSGRLHLLREQGEKSLFFEEGWPVFATSSIPADGLADMLWREGRLTRDQVACTRSVGASPVTVGELLVEQGLVAREELPLVLRGLVERILHSCFGWIEGRFWIGPDASLPEVRVHLATHPYTLVLEGMRRKVGLDHLIDRLGSGTTEIRALPRLREVAEIVDLSEGERAAVAVIAAGPHTLDELLAIGAVGEHATYALVAALLDLEVVQCDVAARTGPGARDRLLARHRQIQDADYFSILGLPRDCSSFEVEAAWQDARREVDEIAAASPDLSSLAIEVGEVMDEAHEILGDEDLLQSYREHLVE